MPTMEDLKNQTYLSALLGVVMKVHKLQEGFSVPQRRLLALLFKSFEAGNPLVRLSDLAVARNESEQVVSQEMVLLVSRGCVDARRLLDGRTYLITTTGRELYRRMEQTLEDHPTLQQFLEQTASGWSLPVEGRSLNTAPLRRRVLELLKKGPATRTEIRQVLMVSNNQIHHTLANLRAEGYTVLIDGQYNLNPSAVVQKNNAERGQNIRAAMLEALRSGPMTRAQLVEGSGLTEKQVDRQFPVLIDLGLIRRCAKGFELTEQARAGVA
jgi:biotin operon repressor